MTDREDITPEQEPWTNCLIPDHHQHDTDKQKEHHMSTATNYTNAENVPASALQVGDVVLKPRNPDRPYRITRVDVLEPTGRIKVRATSVYARYGLGASTFGRFAPDDAVLRVVTP